MAKIDEMITRIERDEAPDLPGQLTDDAKKRIEDRVLSAVFAEAEAGTVISVPKRRKKKRGYLVLIAAVVLLMAFGLTSFGAANPDWDIEIIRMMGLENADTLQLPGGEVKIDKAVTVTGTEHLNGKTKQKEVTITALTSVGDKNSAYIHVTTDYKLPDGFDEKTDYIMPAIYSVAAHEKKDGAQSEMGSTGMYLNDNGYLGYMFEISNCKNLNKSYVTINLGDFYWYHDLGMNGKNEIPEKKESLLLEGKWTLSWKFEYKSNAKSYSMSKRVEIDGVPYQIRKVEVTPISIRMEGFKEQPKLYDSNDQFTLEEIRYEDGTVIKTEGFSSGGCRDGKWVDTFFGMDVLKEPLVTEKIQSIVVAAEEIMLR